MATLFGPQDNSNFTQAQWQLLFGSLLGNGTIQGQLNSYVVTTTSGLGISVASGRAIIQGFLAQSDAAVALTAAAADPTNPRIDRAILHADLAAHTLTVQMLTGTPAPSPAAPALTQTSTVWEISLYQVRVNATQTTLTGGSLTDERSFSGLVNKGGDTMTGALSVTGGTTSSPDALKVVNPITPTYVTLFGTADTGGPSGGGWYAYDQRLAGYIFSGGTRNGIFWSAPVTGVGGQAAVGAFGVPVIVAQALRTSVAVTTAVTILTYSVPVNGTYRVTFSVQAHNGTNNWKLRAQINFTDADGIADSMNPLGQNATGDAHIFDGIGTSIPITDSMVNILPMVVEANVGAMTCVYQVTGTPNDKVTVIIERLA